VWTRGADSETLQILNVVPLRLQDIDDGDTSQVHHRFVAKALQPLVALLLEQLVKQEVRHGWRWDAERTPALLLAGVMVEDGIAAHAAA